MYCLHTNTYHYFTVEDAIESAKTAGFAGIEIATVKGWTEHVMPYFDEDRIEEIAGKIESAGLSVRAMSGHSDLKI